MKITYLGTGTYGADDRALTSFLVNDELLLDVGSGTIRQLQMLGKDLAKINTIIITHYHPDHFSDVLSFLVRRKVNKITSQLTIVGPKNIRSMTVQMIKNYGSDIFTTADEIEEIGIDFVELVDSEKEVNGYKIISRTAKHGECRPASCYQINQVSFSGDSTRCVGLDEIIRSSSQAFLDSTKNLPSDDTHLNIGGVLEYAEQYPNKKFYLIHRGDYDLPDLPSNAFAPDDGDEIKIEEAK
ncbi:MAG: MBL fold metallo-hydrolase [Candidatus Nomurabacteria bacterium]|jgi:ribonuclease BN (tRNA processing enzyme)|nr:MBL fold metallo-hydrolase [Candidatus Nomurabacteria bacterium]